MPSEIFKDYIKLLFAGGMCSCHGCQPCREFFHESGCPENETRVNQLLYEDFCKRAYEKLMEMLSEEDDDMPFPKDWSEDDLIKILMEK